MRANRNRHVTCILPWIIATLLAACSLGTTPTQTPTLSSADVPTVTPTASPTSTPESLRAFRIVYVAFRDANSDIYVMNDDGSGATNLTNNPDRDNYPTWSPDGTRIVFQSDRDGNDELYVMNGDGSGVTRTHRQSGIR